MDTIVSRNSFDATRYSVAHVSFRIINRFSWLRNMTVTDNNNFLTMFAIQVITQLQCAFVFVT